MANYDEFAHICSCTPELILAGLRIFIWPKRPALPIRMFLTEKVTKRKHSFHISKYTTCISALSFICYFDLFLNNNQFSDKYLQTFFAVG